MLSLLRTRRFAPLFLTQLLGALNDNLFKSALVVVVTLGVAGRHEGLGVDALVQAATAALIAPFFLFSALAGELADRHDKARLIGRLKLVEVGVMGMALLGFALSSLPLLFAALALMGTQSAFFGPLKYGILPQHLAEGELVDGNGLVEMGTFVAILLGTLVGGLVVAVPEVGVWALGALLLAVAAAGYLAARAIPEAPPVETGPVDWNLPRGIARTLRLAKANRPAWLAILGASWFWFLGALVLSQLPLYATELLGGDEATITLMLAVFTLGIGVGSVACAQLSGGRIELGFVAPASLAMVVLLADGVPPEALQLELTRMIQEEFWVIGTSILCTGAAMSLIAIAFVGTAKGVKLRAGLGLRGAPLATFVVAPIGILALGPVSDLMRRAMQYFLPWFTLGSLEGLDRVANAAPLYLVVPAMALVPGVAEELLFRGMFQSSIRFRWFGVVMTGVLFAAYHTDPHHVAAVLPLGIYLSWLRMRTGSTLVPITAHIANNATAVIASVLLEGGAEGETLDWYWIPIGLAVAGFCCAVVWYTTRGRNGPPREA